MWGAARARQPRVASTAAPPKASGIDAATGERKTKSRTRSRIGTAISSAVRVESTDSSWIARESVAKPRLLGADRRANRRTDRPIELLHRLADSIGCVSVEVDEDQCLALGRPQPLEAPPVPRRQGADPRLSPQRRGSAAAPAGRAPSPVPARAPRTAPSPRSAAPAALPPAPTPCRGSRSTSAAASPLHRHQELPARRGRQTRPPKRPADTADPTEPRQAPHPRTDRSQAPRGRLGSSS